LFHTTVRSLKRSLQRNYKSQITTFSVLVLTFSVLLSFWNVFGNIREALFDWGDQIKLDVYLHDDIDDKSAEKVKNFLTTSALHKKLNYISKEQAAINFRKKLSKIDSDLIGEGGVGNPLPNSFEFILNEEASVADKFSEVKKLAEQLMKMEGVEEASYGKSWIENYQSLIKGFSSTSIGVMIILFIGSLMIIGNEINASMALRFQEIEIYELIGATKLTVQIPFIIEGGFLGFVSMIVAIVVGSFISTWQHGILNTDLGFMSIQWSYLGMLEMFCFVMLGALTGMLGSFLCVKNINSGWSAVEKNIWDH
jgi:cell division transport system permease protein